MAIFISETMSEKLVMEKLPMENFMIYNQKTNPGKLNI